VNNECHRIAEPIPLALFMEIPLQVLGEARNLRTLTLSDENMDLSNLPELRGLLTNFILGYCLKSYVFSLPGGGLEH
jgi:hypothetical protein